ncbi:hypothetical protein LXA43DRAFT_1022584 [Ganoderma leucocontextum]|nr:hypothetical protein LXA43DRAFT_1022584 [Ganoderma leucocontextum]
MMLDDGQEMRHLDAEEEKIRMFEDNDDFRERLDILQEIAPDHAAYNLNCISTAFRRAITRRPLNVPPPPTLRQPLSSGRQTKITEYFQWPRKFPDLPMEVILEIASHLTPLAFLNFSRTSRLFRKTFMNKASRWVWQGALRTVPGLPPCPDDLNEALYTALVFDRHCFGCGAPDAFSVDYALRLRLCESCWKVNVTDGVQLLDEVSCAVYRFVLMLIPSANTFNFKSFKNIRRSITRVNPQTHIMQDSYYKPELQALLDFFWPHLLTAGDLTKLRAAFLDRAEHVVRRQTHAVELYAWERVVGAEGHMVSNATLKRATEDCYYLDFGFSIGWHMNPRWDLVPVDDDPDYILVPSPEAIAQGGTLCLFFSARNGPHPASPVALNTNPPKSKAQIAKEHRSRADRECVAYHLRLEYRYNELSQWYEEILEDDEHLNEDELPNAYDGARLFDALATRNDARAEIHQISVGACQETALVRARTYSFDVRCALAALLSPPHTHQKETRAFLRDMLARPTALFVCDFLGCRGDHGFQWPAINWHWRDAHEDESVWIPAFGGTQHRYIRATVWAKGAELANTILDTVGLARDTAMHRLDKLCKQGRLYCACGDPGLSTSPGWGQLVRHVHYHLKMDERRRPCNGLPWINDHRDLKSCIKLLPKDADTFRAFARISADPGTTARIDSFCAARPDGAWLVCSLCAAMVHPKKAPSLLPIADEIVYHMQAKHGLPFDEKNVLFQQYPRPPPEKVQLDLPRFCRA